MVMRLPSRFMATRSGTVTFFGAGVDVPPYWSLMSNLRPGRLRAGPGVNAIVPLRCISQDSFQIADRPYEEQARRDHDSDAAPDDEGLSRAERSDDRRENDWSQGKQQGSAEEVDARHTPKEFSRYVLLCTATEYIAHEDRQCNRERTEEAQDDDRPRKDKDPKPLDREGVSETFAHLPQDGHGGRRLATWRPREPYGPKAREERCRVE